MSRQPSERFVVIFPRYRWKDAVAEDLEEPNWTNIKQKRKEWRALILEANIHFGSLTLSQHSQSVTLTLTM